LENLQEPIAFERLTLGAQLKQVSDSLLSFSFSPTETEQLRIKLIMLLESLERPL